MAYLSKNLVWLTAACSWYCGTIVGCRTRDPAQILKETEQALPAAWEALSFPKKGTSPCVAATAAQNRPCAYLDPEMGLVWTSLLGQGKGAKSYPWSEAKNLCAQLNRTLSKGTLAGEIPATLGKWRLPNRGDMDRATLLPSGLPRGSSLQAQQRLTPESFGVLPAAGVIWTESPSENGVGLIWAGTLTRANHFLYGLRKPSDPAMVRCVAEATAASKPNHPQLLTKNDLPSTTSESVSTVPALAPATTVVPPLTTQDLKRQPAAIVPSNLRELVISELKKTLQGDPMATELLDLNGSLLLGGTTGYSFEEATSRLSPSAEAAAKKLLLDYVSGLQKMAAKENFDWELQVIGYSSPSFRGAPMGEAKNSEEAKTRNLWFGLARAAYVAQLLPSQVNGRDVAATAYTRGATESILNATATPSKCQPFDCEASRRALVRFILLEKKEVNEGRTPRDSYGE